MRPEYIGVKYYSSNDMSIGYNFEQARKLLDALDENKEYTDVNEIIELYNVNQIITSPGIKAEYSTPYLKKATGLLKPIAKFFKAISDSSLLDYYHAVCITYLDDFWTLFDKFQVYGNISDSVFDRLLNEPETTLYRILEHKGIVRHFDKTIASFMRQSDQSARIIVSKYLEKKSLKAGKECFLPVSLKPNELESILDKYIDSENSNVGVLQLIALSQSSAECPISDVLRLKARKKAQAFWETHASEGLGFTYGMGVCFKSNPEIISYEEIKPLEYQIVYDVDWIKNNLDYPTLLNNFIYLFGYVDLCYRCSFVSIESKMGITERFLGIKGVKEYETGMAFSIANIKSSAELQGYSAILSECNIRIEDLIQWFFSEYLRTEFNADGFVINMPSRGSTTLEKCRTLPSEMDGIIKQYRMYVNDHAINRELLEMSSNPVHFYEIPSMIERKYVYANSDNILREQFLLFSDQSMLHYLPNREGARSFYELLSKNTIKSTEYPEWEMADLRWLESRNVMTIDVDGTIKMNVPRIKLLRDLYEHGVICASYYKNADILDRLVGSGDLRFDSSLFSIPEQNYLNYMLNKSEYSNGLDLRNKYIHSTYPTDVNQQEHDYINLLKIMVIVILKINEEFCLMNPV